MASTLFLNEEILARSKELDALIWLFDNEEGGLVLEDDYLRNLSLSNVCNNGLIAMKIFFQIMVLDLTKRVIAIRPVFIQTRALEYVSENYISSFFVPISEADCQILQCIDK